MIHHLEYSRARLAQASGRLRAAMWAETRPLDELLVSEAAGRVSHADAQWLPLRTAQFGERFGPLWSTHWFRGAGTVPEEWSGRRVDLLWDSCSEATLWLDGVAVQGLNRHHPDAFLQRDAVPGPVTFEVELACNGMCGRLDPA